jgi:hypothetical protein
MQTKHKEGTLSGARFVSEARNGRKALEFRTIVGVRNACIQWKWLVGKDILIQTRMSFVRNVASA